MDDNVRYLMVESSELAKRIRKVLADEITWEPEKLDRTVERILEVMDPFQDAAREELERFRSTFSDLAK